MPGIKLWYIWRPFKRENYRCTWNDCKLLGIVRQFFDDVKYTYQRARYGYCDLDLWNIDSWFLDIIPREMQGRSISDVHKIFLWFVGLKKPCPRFSEAGSFMLYIFELHAVFGPPVIISARIETKHNR